MTSFCDFCDGDCSVCEFASYALREQRAFASFDDVDALTEGDSADA